MQLSTRCLSVFGLPLVAALAVSCAQSGTGSLTSPSAASAAAAATAAGPSAGYSATGMWRFVSVLNGDEETFDTFVTQLANGDLRFVDEDDSVVTLERLSQGDGRIITYRIANVGDEGGECLVRSKGTILLDTTTNTLTANIRLKELGCENQRAEVTVTGTKL